MKLRLKLSQCMITLPNNELHGFQPPHSSHMGGMWERMIRTTQRILDSMLLGYDPRSLSHNVLTTFLAEASSTMNSRLLVLVSTDPDDPFILTPSTLLIKNVEAIDATYVSANVEQKYLLRKQ